jgi:hypothetical protein
MLICPKCKDSTSFSTVETSIVLFQIVQIDGLFEYSGDAVPDLESATVQTDSSGRILVHCNGCHYEFYTAIVFENGGST